MSPDPVELRRYAHLLDRGLPPADEAAHFSWLYRLAATHRTLRLYGDVVAMQPQDWAALQTLGRMFGWCPFPGRLPLGGRELAHYASLAGDEPWQTNLRALLQRYCAIFLGFSLHLQVEESRALSSRLPAGVSASHW